MDERPYLITSLNEMPGKERWVRGVAEVLGNTVQPVIIMWEPEFAVPTGWIVRRMRRPYPGHLQKLTPLLEMGLDPDRWFVFTDGSDVSFQTTLPDLGAVQVPVLLSNEGLRHGDSAFWTPHLRLPIFAALRDMPIYNVGSWAAVGHEFLDFVGYQAAFTDTCRAAGIHLLPYHDQLIHNLWVRANSNRCGEMEGLFCTLYASFTGPDGGGSTRARLIDGRFVTADGQPYAIVHANGSTKKILDDLPVTAADSGLRPTLALRTGE
jgi:hypothetical protein